MPLTFDAARAFLAAHGQEHVLAHGPTLKPAEQAALLAQLETLDSALLADLQARVNRPPDHAAAAPEPADAVRLDPTARAQAIAAGEAALRAGQVGVILVAGGQGTRLGYDGPKGAYSVGPLSGDSLFAVHAKKIAALERRFAAPVPFYIMTSDANDAATRAFFAEHRYFGLDSERVLFFRQGMLPALFPDGRLVLETPGRLFMGPDGHGGLLQALAHNGLLADMDRRRLEALFYFQVDNPLVDIADPAFIGLHLQRRSGFSLKVCAKRDPDEGLGVITRHGEDGLMIVEYTELTPAQKNARRPDGRLRFHYGSVAIHAFSRAFLEEVARTGLPLHTAHKKVPYFDGDRQVAPDAPNAFKFEKFIFDALPLARPAVALEFERASEFSPVKNAAGPDSKQTAQRDMTRKFAAWLETAGATVARRPDGEIAFAIEIDPLFAASPEELARKVSRGFSVTGPTWLKNEGV